MRMGRRGVPRMTADLRMSLRHEPAGRGRQGNAVLGAAASDPHACGRASVRSMAARSWMHVTAVQASMFLTTWGKDGNDATVLPAAEWTNHVLTRAAQGSSTSTQ